MYDILSARIDQKEKERIPLEITYVDTISPEDYNALRKSAGWPEKTPAQMQKSIEGSSYLIAAICEGKTIGAARLISDGGSYGIIADVIVLPEFQGAGVGGTMIRAILDYVKSGLGKGESFGLNLIAAKDRETFYEQFGFERRPTDQFGHGMSITISMDEPPAQS